VTHHMMKQESSNLNIQIYKAKIETDVLNILQSCTELNEPNMTFLLDKSSVDHPIQRCVYDIAMFHFQRLGIEWNDTKHVEFWFKNDTNPSRSLHIDCDEYDRQVNKTSDCRTCISSSILYLSDNNNVPTIITDVDRSMYKYKEFVPLCERKIAFSYPTLCKHICFSGGELYHGALSLTKEYAGERRMLIVNLWDTRPLNVPYFQLDYFFFKYSMLYKHPWNCYGSWKESSLTLEPCSVITTKTIPPTVLTDECYDDLLYTNSETPLLMKNLLPLMSEHMDTIIFSHENADAKITPLQRFVFEKHFTKDVCIWIIQQYEEFAARNGGWTTDRHKLYPTTDLPAEAVEHVFSFILTSFKETISKHIVNAYNLKNVSFGINDIFIVKYEATAQHSLGMHSDNSHLTVNILLSDPSNDFSGGGTRFEDNMAIFLNQGDLLIHDGSERHEGLPITQGTRYLIVFFLNMI